MIRRIYLAILHRVNTNLALELDSNLQHLVMERDARWPHLRAIIQTFIIDPLTAIWCARFGHDMVTECYDPGDPENGPRLYTYEYCRRCGGPHDDIF